MVLDSETEKQLLLHVIRNFPMIGSFAKITMAAKELDRLYVQVVNAQIGGADTGAKRPTLKEVKK